MQPTNPPYRFLAKNGHLVMVRPLQTSDTPLLVDIFEHLSSESRYHRFQQTVDHVPPTRIWQEAEQIATVDPIRKHGLLAVLNGLHGNEIPLGAARWVALNELEAEVAISIRDDYQGLGIGTKLMQLLADEAHERGFARLSATIENDNPAILHVFSRLTYDVLRIPDGSASDIIIVLTESHKPDEKPIDNLLSGYF